MKIHYCLLVLFSLMDAQNIAWSTTPEECNYEGTQAQMNACAIRDFNTADAELNLVYKKLIRSLTPEDGSKIREEQRAWLKQRDPLCKKEADGDAEGGSMWPVLYNSCREQLTKVRILQLQKLDK